MATKIQRILDSNPNTNVLFGDWLSKQGLDAKGQYSYQKSGWLSRLSKGVYTLQSSSPSLLETIAAYNTQLSKRCVVGAFTALELRGYSHYVPMGKQQVYLFTGKDDRLPLWLLEKDWDMTIDYMVTSFLGEDQKGVDTVTVNGVQLLVSSPERALLECLNLPEISSSLLDLYYIMESLTTLRPNLLQSLLESCTSKKVKRLFLYMAEKAGHQWYKALNLDTISLGTSRCMIVPTGKYLAKYNMTIPKDLFEYE